MTLSLPMALQCPELSPGNPSSRKELFSVGQHRYNLTMLPMMSSPRPVTVAIPFRPIKSFLIFSYFQEFKSQVGLASAIFYIAIPSHCRRKKSDPGFSVTHNHSPSPKRSLHLAQ